jgi:hypothetical protein
MLGGRAAGVRRAELSKRENVKRPPYLGPHFRIAARERRRCHRACDIATVEVRLERVPAMIIRIKGTASMPLDPTARRVLLASASGRASPRSVPPNPPTVTIQHLAQHPPRAGKPPTQPSKPSPLIKATHLRSPSEPHHFVDRALASL